MTEKELEIFDLDALIKPVGKIKVFGEEHLVLPIDGLGQQILQTIVRTQATDTLEVQMGRSRDIVAMVAPSLSKEQLLRLDFSLLTAIIGISGKHVEMIQKMLLDARGKGRGPVAKKRGVRPGRR